MKDVAIIILVLFSLANALIVWYFLVYKNKQADDEYAKRLKGIYERGSAYDSNRGS